MKYARHAAILALGVALGVGSLFIPESVTANASLMSPAGIEDQFLGESAAPATLIVYSSPTCSYCIDFEKNVLPQLQEKYVETGKLRVSVRPFIRNAVDAVVFQVANKAGSEKYRQTTEAFTNGFDRLAEADDVEAVLREIAASQGVEGDAFDQAVADDEYFNKLNAMREQAIEKFGVKGTPTFFLNGESFEFDGSLASIEAALEKVG